MDENQFAQVTAGKVEQRDVQTRQVQGGFVMLGMRRFVDPNTQAIAVQMNTECVANTAEDCASKFASFITTGEF